METLEQKAKNRHKWSKTFKVIAYPIIGLTALAGCIGSQKEVLITEKPDYQTLLVEPIGVGSQGVHLSFGFKGYDDTLVIAHGTCGSNPGFCTNGVALLLTAKESGEKVQIGGKYDEKGILDIDYIKSMGYTIKTN